MEAFRLRAEQAGLDDDRLSARAADLFLVTAVLEGQTLALSYFDNYVAEAAQVTLRLDRSADFMDEVKQQLRIRLLAGDRRKLAAYAGTGTLIDWLRVSAWRVGLNIKRSEPRMVSDQMGLAALVGAEDDEALKRFYLNDFQQAIEASFQGLTVRERTLLRLHFVNGFNIERIGVIYGVHRATVARWLVTIRQRLLGAAKLALAARHGLHTGEVKSLYRLLQRDVDLSVSRLLKAE